MHGGGCRLLEEAGARHGGGCRLLGEAGARHGGGCRLLKAGPRHGSLLIGDLKEKMYNWCLGEMFKEDKHQKTDLDETKTNMTWISTFQQLATCIPVDSRTSLNLKLHPNGKLTFSYISLP